MHTQGVCLFKRSPMFLKSEVTKDHYLPGEEVDHLYDEAAVPAIQTKM